MVARDCMILSGAALIGASVEALACRDQAGAPTLMARNRRRSAVASVHIRNTHGLLATHQNSPITSRDSDRRLTSSRA
jgi:hypothetical protein